MSGIMRSSAQLLPSSYGFQHFCSRAATAFKIRSVIRLPGRVRGRILMLSDSYCAKEHE